MPKGTPDVARALFNKILVRANRLTPKGAPDAPLVRSRAAVFINAGGGINLVFFFIIIIILFSNGTISFKGIIIN